MKGSVLTFLILCLKCWFSNELFEGCNHILRLNQKGKLYINSPYYPALLPPGTSCRYTVEAPTDFRLKFTCALNFNMKNSSHCDTEIFYYNSKGSELLSESEFYCGSGIIKKKSHSNRATISYISSGTNTTKNTGVFSCLVESIKLSCDCGYSTRVKILGGREATAGEFPSLAAVIRKADASLVCSATIIHHRYLLSAAHCYTSLDAAFASLLEVIVGMSDISAIYNSLYAQRYNVEKIILHENFRSVNLANDIALLKTAANIKWNRVVFPACLPFRFVKKTFDGHTVRTAGWGTKSFGGQLSYKLLKTNLNVLNNDVCKQIISSVTSSQLCTSTQKGDTCQYDSGSGLFFKTNVTYVVGIVSYGYGCGGGQIPSVNLRVTTYLNWVRSNTEQSRFCVK